uniref:Scavenger receptor class B member 1 n=1 Tax=Aceria tosichella TaxID=561515 RepID=A0A6G1S5J1_9ACAR
MAFPLINVKFILLISASFIAIFSSIAIYFCLPILISHMIRTQITLSATSGSFENWRLNSVVDRMYLYNISNLGDLNSELIKRDNSGSIRKSRQVPRLQQLGPFTFRQDREKLNIKFDAINETVIYDQKKSWTFLPELSSLKSIDAMKSSLINHISVPLAGTTLSPEFGEFIDPIVAENDLKLFLSHSIDTLLFEGYHDILMEQAKASGQVDVDKFGWMHNQNNSVVKSIRVFTGPSNTTLDKFGLIDQFDHKQYMNIWHNNNSDPKDFQSAKCNHFRLSSAGEFFPPPDYSIIDHNSYYRYAEHQQQLQDQQRENQLVDDGSKKENASSEDVNGQLSPSTEPNLRDSSGSGSLVTNSETVPDIARLKPFQINAGKSISIFMPELCRTIRLFYNGSYTYKDKLLVDRYIANEETFMYQANEPVLDASSTSSTKESNGCYCTYNANTRTTSCPPNGMMDLFSCRKGSPVGISFPHFLYSTKDRSLEPYLRLFTDEVEPNVKEHQFFIDLEATLNLPVNVQIVLQFNVRLRNDQQLNFTKEYAYLFEDPSGDSGRQQLKDFYLPQMWVKSTAEVDDTNLAHLVFIQKHLKLVTPLTTIVIFSFASILLAASAKLAYDLTYGPARKSSMCEHEACSSFSGSHSCGYLEEKKKKKYLDMQLLAQREKPTSKSAFNFASSMGNIPTNDFSKTNFTNHSSFDELNRPTTSRNANNFVIAASSSSSNSQHDCESQPLNK